MSTRVSDTPLYNQFPWLRERVKAIGTAVAGRHYSRTLEEEHVLTESDTQVSLEIKLHGEKSPAKPARATGQKIDRTELQKLEGRIESGEEGEDEEFKKIGEGEVQNDRLIFDLGADLPAR